MTTITDQAVIADIQAAYNSQDWQTAYQLVFDAITTTTTVKMPDSSVPETFQDPSAGVDAAVWTWIAGARNVNSGTGAFASYIRDYTAEQYNLRTGSVIPATGPTSIQEASNSIAKRFVADLFGKLPSAAADPLLSVITGSFTSLTLPDLHRIGLIDAGAAASQIFKSTTIDGRSANYSPWAGTLLFTRLGDASFFQDWVLTTGTNDFKREAGTYDLATIAKAAADQGGLSFLLQVIFAGEVGTAIDVTTIGASAVATALAAATAFFNQVYGPTGGTINIGADIFSVTGQAASAKYVVGTTGSDAALTSIDSSVFLNAGRGDDTIIGAFDPAALGYSEVIDGAEGTDTIDYGKMKTGVNVSFENVGQLGARAVVDKNPDIGGDKDYVYEIENFKFGSGADTVFVKAGAVLSAIKSIDAAGQAENEMDVLNFSQFDGEVSITNSVLDGAGTRFQNFEKIILSNQADTIKVSAIAELGGLKEIDGGGNSYGDLIVKLRGHDSDSVFVHNDLALANGGVSSGLQYIETSDGSKKYLGQGTPITFTWLTSGNNYNLWGTNFGQNIYEVTTGDGSIIFGNPGALGSNKIEYHLGAGLSDVSVSGSKGLVAFAAGISAQSVYLQANSYGDLYIRIRDDSSDSIFVHNALSSQAGLVVSAITELDFSDGSVVHLGQGADFSAPLTFNWIANGNNYYLYGSNFGTNVYEVTSGNGSIVFGNGLMASNVIEYTKGGGVADVSLNGGMGRIKFSAGISAQDLYMQSNSYGDLTFKIRGDDTDAVFVHNALTQNSWGVSSAIQDLEFSDGSIIHLGQPAAGQGLPLTLTWIGAGNNAAMTGSGYGRNIFEFGSGSETATGGSVDKGGPGDNTYKASASTGQAMIYANEAPGSINDLEFVGGITDDQLWFLQSGNDLRIDILGTNTQVSVKDWFSNSNNVSLRRGPPCWISPIGA